jgi:2'-hydroxyisoflavone reductase
MISGTDCSRALASGLRFRPLVETVRDTLAWDRTRPQDAALQAGLSAEKERRLLAAWKAEAGGTR